jgi:hypothetical protein
MKIKGAVFTNDAIDRPHSGNVIDPSGGSARDHPYDEPCLLGTRKGTVSTGQEFSIRGQRVIDIGQESLKAGADLYGNVLNGFWHPEESISRDGDSQGAFFR